MSFNYLNTLRLNQSAMDAALLVGPQRRVVFYGVKIPAEGKSAIKRALKPLNGYWSKPEQGERGQSGVNFLSYRDFRNNAKRLLLDAGLLATTEE